MDFLKNFFKRQTKEGQQELPVDLATRKQIVDQTLTALNIKVEWMDEEDDKMANFDYQNGHFQLRLEKNNPYAHLLYLFVYTTESDNLQLVRHLCNESNINSDIEKLAYSVNGEKNEIDIHVLSSILIVPEYIQPTLVKAMGRMFGWQNAFVRRFDQLRQQSEADKMRDPEKRKGEWTRELSLMREAELFHQPMGNLRTADPPREPLLLGELLRTVMGVEKPFLRLTLWIGMRQVVVESPERIARFNLLTVARQLNKGEYLMAVVELMPTDKEERRYDVSITVKADGEDDQAAYFRMSCHKVANETAASVGYQTKADDAVNFVVAYDKRDDKLRHDEFRYMWKEAVEMHKKGEDKDMTTEQHLVCEIMDEEVAGFIYRGTRLFLQKRFAEALLPLEHAFLLMQPHYDSFKPSVKDAFYEVVYHIGFCHCELRHFTQAAYYLDILMPLRRINYTVEYVNCLCNSGDVRAENVVDELLMQTDPVRYDDEEEGMPSHIQGFRNFLRRRKVYLYIEKGKFAAARSSLREMLNEPENADFAIQELAYIKQQEENNPNVAKDDTDLKLPF